MVTFGGTWGAYRHGLIGLALIAGTGVVFFLFVIEPRRKIYDYDPSDYDPRDPR